MVGVVALHDVEGHLDWTTSGMTGIGPFTPGVMEEPFWRGGRLISPNPQPGTGRTMSRRSLDILERFTAQVLTAPETATKLVQVLGGVNQD